MTNGYNANPEILPGDAALNVKKTLKGRDEWTAHDVFTFTLTGEDGAPMPEGADPDSNTKTITLGQADEEGGLEATGNFGDIQYGMDDRGKTYVYTITENAGDVYGMTYSGAEYKVTVTVTDDGDGTLTVEYEVVQTKTNDGTEIAGDDQPAVTEAEFINTYDKPEDEKTVSKIEADDAKTEINGQLVGVGDTLEYTVHWVNDAIDPDTGDSGSG